MDDLKALRDEIARELAKSGMEFDPNITGGPLHPIPHSRLREWAARLTSIIERNEKGCMNCGENPAHYCHACWEGSDERNEKERAFTEAAKEEARLSELKADTEDPVAWNDLTALHIEAQRKARAAYRALTERAKP